MDWSDRSPGVTVELGEPGMIGMPDVVTVPGLPGVVRGTDHRVLGTGSWYGNGSFRPRVVSALSRFGPGSFRPGSFRPGSIRPWVVSA